MVIPPKYVTIRISGNEENSQKFWKDFCGWAEVVFAANIAYNEMKQGGVKNGCNEKGRDLYHR